MIVSPNTQVLVTRLDLWLLPWMNILYHFGTVEAGGDDPTGVDCSGFVSQYLQAFGALPQGTRLTAAGIAQRFAKQAIDDDDLLLYPYLSESSANARRGSLQFMGNPKDFSTVHHVNICIGDNLVVGAMRGDSTTITDAVAAKKNAFVQQRPIDYWKTERFYLDPFGIKE